MKLKRLTLDNYGLYRGTVSFDLRPRQDNGRTRPVILFGGQNGAGKTTLFDAFRVVLYGKSALNGRVGDAEYRKFLKSRIHRSAKALLQPKSSYIEIEFEYVPLGAPVTYVVRRAWELGNGNVVSEKLFISQNGVSLQSVSQEYWQGFVEEIIPQRLSSLFFFDGEKIKKIAEDEDDNVALADSIKTLLGLDVAERLHADLVIYKTREAQKIGPKKQVDDLQIIGKIIDDSKEKIEIIAQNIAATQSHIDGISSEIRKAEAKLKQEGYVFAQERDQLVSRRAQVENSLEMVRHEIKKEYEGVYPFSLCPGLNESLRKQLLAEKKQSKAVLLIDDLKGLEEQLISGLEGLTDLGTSCLTSVRAAVEKVIQGRLKSLAPLADYTELHAVGSKDAVQMIAWLDDAESRSSQRVGELHRLLDELTRELQEVQKSLDKVPSDVVLEPMVAELNTLSAKRGALLQKRHALEVERSVVEQCKIEAESKLEKICAKISAHDEAGKRVEHVEKVQLALVDYSARLTQAKIDELQVKARDCFNSLSRKGDLIEEIKIDPKTFSVVLKDRFGNILPKKDLSAGEKQMYAVAMLWGLSLISGRSLPVIIDTPLGRLDSEHRKNLVSKYFPFAAEQVIVLSTDTEIDKQWYNELRPWVSHSYMLINKVEENYTDVESRYFWKEQEG